MVVREEGGDKSGGVAIMGNMTHVLLSDKNVPYLDSINVKTLVVILHYSSARCHY